MIGSRGDQSLVQPRMRIPKESQLAFKQPTFWNPPRNPWTTGMPYQWKERNRV